MLRRSIRLFRRRARNARDILLLLSHAKPTAVMTLIALHIITGLAPVAFILGSGFLVAEIKNERELVLQDLALPLVLLLGASLCQQLVGPAQTMMAARVRLQIDEYCSLRLTKKALSVPDLREMESDKVAQSLADAHMSLDNTEITPGGASEGALALVARYAQLLGAVAIITVYSSFALALCGLLLALVNRFSQTLAFTRWSKAHRRLVAPRRRMWYLRELATDPRNARDIKAHSLHEWIDRQYLDTTTSYLQTLWRHRRSTVTGPPIMILAIISGLVGTLLILTLKGSPGPSGFEEVAAFVMTLQAMLMCITFGVVFPEADTKMQYGRDAWTSIVEFEKFTAGSRGASECKTPLSLGDGAMRMGGSVDVENLSYEYATGAPVLQRLNLRIGRGKSTAIVGVNGAGKSTLVKLLCGLYEPSAGSIKVDGESLSRDRVRWQSKVAVVFQDFVRYELTLRENIAAQHFDAIMDEDGMNEVLSLVGLEGAISYLPDGLDTPVSRLLSAGIDFSGGEWQRIALARALFAAKHGAEILILDEPTSQLDARKEAEFYRDFLNITRGITTVIISHRFSSVRNADNINVLKGGCIVESGDHQELLARKGNYWRMFEAQSRKYRLA